MSNSTQLTTAKAQKNLLDQTIELLTKLGKAMEQDAKERRVPWDNTYAESAIASAIGMIETVGNSLRLDDARAMINQQERKALAAMAHLCKGWRANGVPDGADNTMQQLLFHAFPDIKWESVANRLNQ